MLNFEESSTLSLVISPGTAHVCLPVDDRVPTDVLPCLLGIFPRAPISRRSDSWSNPHGVLGESSTPTHVPTYVNVNIDGLYSFHYALIGMMNVLGDTYTHTA